MFETFAITISWWELLKRTAREFIADDCLSLAAQLAYYFFLALFPALLFLLSLASFFPLHAFTDQVVNSLAPVAPPAVLEIIRDQMLRISNAENSGLLTLGFVGAIWSSSAAMTSIASSLNKAYDIEEGRPWWNVRLIAIGLTVALALLILISFTLVVAGPDIAEAVASRFGLGGAFEWTWKIVQWPLAFVIVTFAVGLVYYFGPDAEQSWEWITPGAAVATVLWLLVSIGFRVYVTHFGDYNAAYGTIGGVIVLMLWFYASSLALLAGAEMNAEIEHASPYGKDEGEKRPGEKKKIGRLRALAHKARGYRPSVPRSQPL